MKQTKKSLGRRANNWLLLTTIFFSKIAAFFASSTKLHNARFAAIHELESLLESAPDHPTSLLLAQGRMDHVLRVRPTKQRSELGNLLVVAPTRGGKGLLAVSQLLTWQNSVIVNDIKGDLFTQTAGYRQSLGPVFCVDPTGLGHRYDPLMGKETEDNLLSSATQLLHKSDEGDGAIFSQRAAVMLTQLFLAARQEGYAPFPYVRACIRDGLVACASRLETINPELATQFLNVAFPEANLSDRFLVSCWGTLDTRMRPLLTETVIRSLSGADFSPQELMCVMESQIYYRPADLQTAKYLEDRLGLRSAFARSKTLHHRRASHRLPALAGEGPSYPVTTGAASVGIPHRRASYNL